MKDRLFDGRLVQAQILHPLPQPPPPAPSSVPIPPPAPLSISAHVTDFDPLSELEPSVAEAVQGVEDFLNSLL
jgi:hypothetical protein